ncbi:D,D-heptose 1,7-bisphosphate phosphatase [Synergistales bacterium]|nr:D,D-heptose 1,7-bisphosphate phosphatase [Synergistales bacterium]
MNKAIFIDRDGTIIRDCGYLSDPNHVELLPGTGERLKAFQDAGYFLVLVTNQSGIGRGYFTETEMNAVQTRLDKILEEYGVKFGGVYYCPHAHWENCACRKPKPMLARKAAADLNIDLSQSCMVGDKQSDIDFGENFGAKDCFYSVEEAAERILGG